MKGILLAGGAGTRLYPTTQVVCKQLLPIYEKPMVYYPLSTLMLLGIRDILIISTPKDLPYFANLFGDGDQLGINIQYQVQLEPKGIAESFLLGSDFIGNDSVCLILGDNIFWGHDFSTRLQDCANIQKGGMVIGYYVNDPERFGVAELDENFNVLSLEEKPKNPKSNWAVVGLYFYGNEVKRYVKEVKPSLRGELEITDLNKLYLEKHELKIKLLGRGYAWLDTGTHEAMLDASKFVNIMETRTGYKIACVEEVAYNMKYINKEQLIKLGEELKSSSYGKYILKVANNGI